jgi:hypothetical protein
MSAGMKTSGLPEYQVALPTDDIFDEFSLNKLEIVGLHHFSHEGWNSD